MTKKLIKIAKELNVASSTIVEFLTNSGFQIENKPIAKISDEMYSLLVDEFSSAIAEKERADELLQERLDRKKPEMPAQTVKENPQTEVTPKEETVEEAPKKEVVKPKETTEVKETKEEEEPVAEENTEKDKKEDVIKPEVQEKEKIQLKVVGKIDLEKAKKPKKKVEEKKEKEKEDEKPAKAIEKQKPVAEKTEADKVEEKEIKKEATDSKENVMIRIEAPKLKGLKIMGKVDQDTIKPKEKRKDSREKTKAGSKATPTQTAGTDQDDASKKRRKRRRKKSTLNK